MCFRGLWSHVRGLVLSVLFYPPTCGGRSGAFRQNCFKPLACRPGSSILGSACRPVSSKLGSGAVFRVCPAQPLLDQAGGGWPPASFAWHRPTQTGLAPGKKFRLSSTRSRAVQVWPLGEETGCVVLTTVCRVGARMGRTSIDVLMPMLCRRHCGSKCTRPRATLV